MFKIECRFRLRRRFLAGHGQGFGGKRGCCAGSQQGFYIPGYNTPLWSGGDCQGSIYTGPFGQVARPWRNFSTCVKGFMQKRVIAGLTRNPQCYGIPRQARNDEVPIGYRTG